MVANLHLKYQYVLNVHAKIYRNCIEGNFVTATRQPIKSACENCHVRKLCLPTSLDGTEIDLMDEVVSHRLSLGKGDHLYKSGDDFHGIYAVKTGALKTSGVTADGREQVTGFHLDGEMVGLDAIDEDRHPCDAVALTHTEVCQLPFDSLRDASSKAPNLLKDLTRIMGREIRREEHVLMLLGSTTAEQRIARFLVNLYERLQKRGAEQNIVTLFMSRQDIGNYLGLAIETVSRQFRNLQDQGIINVDRRNVHVLQMDYLEKLAL